MSLEGAYLERLVLNVLGGSGESEVFLDDLTVTPVPEDVASAPAPEPATLDEPAKPAEAKAARV